MTTKVDMPPKPTIQPTKNMTNQNWLITCKQMKSCLWKILPTRYSFRNVWLNVYTHRQNLALNNLQRLICHKIQTTNQHISVYVCEREREREGNILLSFLLRFDTRPYKRGYSMKLEVTRVGFLVELANHYTIRGLHIKCVCVCVFIRIYIYIYIYMYKKWLLNR